MENSVAHIEHLVSDIMASYKKYAWSPRFLPEKDQITKVTEILRRILFPGYFNEYDTNNYNMEYPIGNLLVQAANILQKQICRALNLENTSGGCEDKFDRAGEIAQEFLGKLPKIREILLTDVRAAFDGDPASGSEHEVIFAYPGIIATSIHRLAHELYLLDVPLIPRIMSEYAHSLTGIDIHPGADIGQYFFIDHGTGVVIGETTKIGDYVKIYQGVTLGALSTRGGQGLKGEKRHPTLEDDVTVYSGASILGGGTVIGKGCVIGGSAFITQSVEPNTRVIMKMPELNFRGI